jgi:hypothetical protein
MSLTGDGFDGSKRTAGPCEVAAPFALKVRRAEEGGWKTISAAGLARDETGPP